MRDLLVPSPNSTAGSQRAGPRRWAHRTHVCLQGAPCQSRGVTWWQAVSSSRPPTDRCPMPSKRALSSLDQVTPWLLLSTLVRMCSAAPVMFSSLRLHGLEPARLLCPWESPGKNTGGCCHFLLQGSSRLRDRTCISHVSCIGSWVLYL